jgi:hypothetical protein
LEGEIPVRNSRRDFGNLLTEALFVKWPDLLNGLRLGECQHRRGRRGKTDLKARVCWNFAFGARPLEVIIGAYRRGGIAQWAKFDAFSWLHPVQGELVATKFSCAGGFEPFCFFEHA